MTTTDTALSRRLTAVTIAVDQAREAAPSMIHETLSTLLLDEALAENRVQALDPEHLAPETTCKSINHLNLSVCLYTCKLMLISCFTAVGTQNKHVSVCHTVKLYANTIWIFWFLLPGMSEQS